MASAPAACAARASASVVAVANQAMPAAFSRSTYGGGSRPMIDDTARGARLEKRLALHVGVDERDVAGRRRHVRPPALHERSHARLGARVPPRRRIGHPRVELKRAGASPRAPPRPSAAIAVGRADERAHRAHAAGVGDGNRQARRARARHRREQHRQPQSVAGAERRARVRPPHAPWPAAFELREPVPRECLEHVGRLQHVDAARTPRRPGTRCAEPPRPPRRRS